MIIVKNKISENLHYLFHLLSILKLQNGCYELEFILH